MLPAQFFLVLAVLFSEGRLQLGTDQVADYADGPRGIDHMDNRRLVMRGNFDRGVCFARGRAANEKRQGKSLALHLPGHMRHFVERRRNESAQPDHIDFLFAGRLQNFFARDHDAEVDDLVVVAAEHHAHDIFADVVNVTFDRRHHYFALGASRAAGPFFRLHERKKPGHRFFHDAGAFDHLGQEHFARAKEVAHHAHAGHQGAFDNGQRAPDF